VQIPTGLLVPKLPLLTLSASPVARPMRGGQAGTLSRGPTATEGPETEGTLSVCY